jgi:hypothetical protein
VDTGDAKIINVAPKQPAVVSIKERQKVTIKAKPVISGLLASSVSKIPGIPLLNKPTPIKQSVPDSELYIPPGNRTYEEKKGVINVESGNGPYGIPNGKIVGVPIAGLTQSRDAALPIVSNKGSGNIVTLPVSSSVAIPTRIPGVPINLIPRSTVIPGVPTNLIPSSTVIPGNNTQTADINAFLKF